MIGRKPDGSSWAHQPAEPARSGVIRSGVIELEDKAIASATIDERGMSKEPGSTAI